MKNTLKLFVIFYLLLQNSSYSQQMIQSITDVYKLKENEASFINKPLKDLLKELKPEIKTVLVMRNDNFFYFKFTERDTEESIEDRISLFVYVKDRIYWNWEQRPKGRETNWTKEDAEKYGNMIVTRISIVY
ncbi:hypothetical protein [Flavobacterium sp.]|uniref:hypothetical protein n=1 Tax=Flavobacterium sp. TaxID=239 RepID=UPI0031E17D8C